MRHKSYPNLSERNQKDGVRRSFLTYQFLSNGKNDLSLAQKAQGEGIHELTGAAEFGEKRSAITLMTGTSVITPSASQQKCRCEDGVAQSRTWWGRDDKEQH